MTDRSTRNDDLIVVEKLGIKISARPGDLGEKPPDSWWQVAQQLNKHLMRIVAGSTRLIAEALEAGTRLARGFTSTSRSSSDISPKVVSAQAVGDSLEEQKQSQLESGQLRLEAEEVSDRLSSILRALQGRGLVAEVLQQADGTMTVVVIRPELQSSVVEALVKGESELGAESAEGQALVVGEKIENEA